METRHGQGTPVDISEKLRGRNTSFMDTGCFFHLCNQGVLEKLHLKESGDGTSNPTQIETTRRTQNNIGEVNWAERGGFYVPWETWLLWILKKTTEKSNKKEPGCQCVQQTVES